jgi:hypothetical protein
MTRGSATPPNVPFWATRAFRMLVLVNVLAVSTLAVYIFEIAPMLRRGGAAEKPVRPPSPDDYVPRGPAAPGEQRPVLFEGMLDKVKDATPIKEEDEPYNYLLRHVAKSDVEVLTKQAKRVDYGLFSRIAPELRGQTVRVMAMYVFADPIRLFRQPPGGLDRVYRTYLVDVSGTEGYVIDLVDPPPNLERRTLVVAEAIFLKLGTYDGLNGPVQAPFLLGRTLRPVKEVLKAGSMDVGVVIVAVLAVVASAIFTVWIIRGARIRTKPAPPPPAEQSP